MTEPPEQNASATFAVVDETQKQDSESLPNIYNIKNLTDDKGKLPDN